PKSRGFTSAIPHPYAVTLDQLERWCKAGDRVTLEMLQKRNLAPQHLIGFKVLNTGTLTKPLTLVDAGATPAAKTAVEKAGGTFERTNVKKPVAKKAVKK
ncbi:MAG TPA: uL15m family ribosomal protein, partial [Candidatus Methylomirabilis sp.]|nr:uL15m family ribosomal protein [Candidatus Methylomirabilis sp.]